MLCKHAYAHAHARILCNLAHLQPHRKRRNVEFHREDLRNTLHQVLLCNCVFTIDNLLKDLGQHLKVLRSPRETVNGLRNYVQSQAQTVSEYTVRSTPSSFDSCIKLVPTRIRSSRRSFSRASRSRTGPCHPWSAHASRARSSCRNAPTQHDGAPGVAFGPRACSSQRSSRE